MKAYTEETDEKYSFEIGAWIIAEVGERGGYSLFSSADFARTPGLTVRQEAIKALKQCSGELLEVMRLVADETKRLEALETQEADPVDRVARELYAVHHPELSWGNANQWLWRELARKAIELGAKK